jgi:hypothetical protein
MITAAQAEVIYTLHREMGVQVGQSFTPAEFFPYADQRRERRALEALALEGYLGRRLARRDEPVVWLEYGKPERLVMTPEALQAYDEWARQGGLMVALTPGPSPIERGEVEAV